MHEIEKRWCADCEQDIVVMQDGLFAKHRHAPISRIPVLVLGPWCKNSRGRV